MLSFAILFHVWFLIHGTEYSTGLQTGSVRSMDSPSPQTGSVKSMDSPSPQTGSVKSMDSPSPQTGSVRSMDSPSPQTGSVRSMDSPSPQTGSVRSMDSPSPQTGSVRSLDSPSPQTVIRFSVPEDHHICLPCDLSDSSNVVWTFQDRKVLVTRQSSYETNEDSRRYRLQSDGDLCLQQLDDSDNGGYRCNQLLVAKLQVLSGQDFSVSEGWTLLLPCRSSKPRLRWSRQKEGGRREVIFTRFRDGTVKSEMDGSRLSFTNDALQIQNLQLDDTGEYLCNGVLQARVGVLTVDHEPTSIPTSTSAAQTSAAMKTDIVETKKKEKKRPENGWSALLLVVVVGLGLMIILMASVCVLLTSMKCRRMKKCRYAAALRHEDTELQPWKTSSGQTECEAVEEMIHYASLGRQNWRDRPGRTPTDQTVIYSSVITRPAAR